VSARLAGPTARALAPPAAPALAAARPGPWLAWAVCGAAAAAAMLALRVWVPAAGTADPICLFERVTGVGCATCGMTRAFALLARGDWPASLALHPMAPVLAAQVVAGWLAWGLGMARRWRRMPERWIPHAVAVDAAALLALWLARLATGTLPG
jgi:hypothetical protein